MAASAWLALSTTKKELRAQTSLYKNFVQTDSFWLYSDKVGSPAASAMARAKVAIGGPLALSSKEVAYLIAKTDNQGRPLTSNCIYHVQGSRFNTRWWSLTLYDSETQNYVPNIDNRSSWNSVAIPYDDDGNWTLTIAATRQGETWLPSQFSAKSNEAKPFEVILRLYNPSDEIRATLPDIALPTVELISC
jgi:hypothetical protein